MIAMRMGTIHEISDRSDVPRYARLRASRGGGRFSPAGPDDLVGGFVRRWIFRVAMASVFAKSDSL